MGTTTAEGTEVDEVVTTIIITTVDLTITEIKGIMAGISNHLTIILVATLVVQTTTTTNHLSNNTAVNFRVTTKATLSLLKETSHPPRTTANLPKTVTNSNKVVSEVSFTNKFVILIEVKKIQYQDKKIQNLPNKTYNLKHYINFLSTTVVVPLLSR